MDIFGTDVNIGTGDYPYSTNTRRFSDEGAEIVAHNLHMQGDATTVIDPDRFTQISPINNLMRITREGQEGVLIDFSAVANSAQNSGRFCFLGFGNALSGITGDQITLGNRGANSCWWWYW